MQTKTVSKKTRPAKMKSGNYETKKSTQAALSEARARRQSSKLETLRRKTIRREKYGNSK